jgi:aminoglycoside phosphotransferase family enzyme/predicted kinase
MAEPEAPTRAQIESLALPNAYPSEANAGGGVRWIQTHISHVFLTRTHVYKLRKAVGLGFLDFSTQAARNADCLREIALNRRLAPDVYLGLAPLCATAERGAFGPVADVLRPGCDHAVVMRRLPDGGDALSLLERGALGAREIDAIAARIAGFHAAHGLGAPAPFAPGAWRERVAAPMRANVAALRDAARAGVVSEKDVEAFAVQTEAAIAAHAAPLERRRVEGRAVDAHGDLHLQHAWFEPADAGDAKLSLIDCIEFSEALRQIDAASEVAFLAMDLRYRGATGLAERFLRRYGALRDDFGLYEVVDFFAAYRAAVRAKVAALAATDAAIAPEQRARAAESVARHFALARALLAPRAAAPLVVVCGSVGTGKSTLAEALADACSGVVISSDRTRKALAGLAPESRAQAHAGAPLYSDATTERVYAALLERAAPVVGSGRAVILDATFGRAEHRDAARRFAAARGVRALLVEATCDEAVARERVAQRAARGGDPSDAGPELVAPSRAHFEPPSEWPGSDAAVVATDASPRAALAAALARWRLSA